MIDMHPGWQENGKNHFRFYGSWEWVDGVTCRPYVSLEMWSTLRETPKGRWIVSDYDSQRQRFVLDTGRKRWAYPTKSEAWASFVIRQRHRLFYARKNLEGVEALMVFIDENKPCP